MRSGLDLFSWEMYFWHWNSESKIVCIGETMIQSLPVQSSYRVI